MIVGRDSVTGIILTRAELQYQAGFGFLLRGRFVFDSDQKVSYVEM